MNYSIFKANLKLSFLCICITFFCQHLYAQVRYQDDIFQELQKQTYEYAVKDGISLKLDVYEAVGDEVTNKAAFIWMHGGGFAIGKRDMPAEVKLMEMAARKGYVAISFSYRLTRKGKSFGCDASRTEKMETFRDASRDFWDAFVYIQKNAKKFKINPAQCIVGGTSAGAEGVLNGVFMKDWLYEDSTAYQGMQPMAIFSISGAVIDSRYMSSKNAIPTVLLHGNADNIVPYYTAPHRECKASEPGYIWLDGSRTIADKLNELDQSYLLLTFAEANHDVAFIPFDHLQPVFEFYQELIAVGNLQQIERTIPKQQ